MTNRYHTTGGQRRYRTLLRIILSMTGVAFMVQFLIRVFGFGAVDYRNLNEGVRAKVTTAQGESLWYEYINLPSLDSGDVIDFYIQLPERPYEGRNALCFYQYHSEITVYCGGKVLYTIGKELTAENVMYGNELCVVPLADEYWGKEIRVHVRQMEGTASGHFTYFRAMRLKDARLYPMIGARLAFVFYGVMMILAVWLLVIAVINQISQKTVPPAMIQIALFSLCISVWQFGFRRLFYIMTMDTRFCALAEYYSLYLAPVPLFVYLGEIKRRKRHKRIYYSMAFVFGAVFCAEIIADLKFHIHLIRFESLEHTMFFIAGCLVMWIELFVPEKITDRQNRTIRGAILIAIALILSQLVFLVIKEVVDDKKVIGILQTMNLPSLAVAIFITAVIMSVNEMAISVIRKSAADEQLRIMALTDELTGMPNRRYCEARLRELQPTDSYSIVFLDVDGLKVTNDVHGHDMGDELIRCTAEVICEAFCFERGFFGRWGGDEFLVVCANEQEAEAFAENLAVSESRFNRRGEKPFRLSISCGIAGNDPQNGKTAEEIRKEADRKMYEQKKQRHRERSEKEDINNQTGV